MRRPGPDYAIGDQKCLICQHDLTDTFCTKGDYRPQSGDVTLCIRCGSVMIFGDDLKLRLPTSTEKATIDIMPDVIASQIFIRGTSPKEKNQ
jgi:hypothetical protein